MRHVVVIGLCLVAGACGSSATSRKEAPDKVLSDEEFVKKLSADADKRGAEEAAKVSASEVTGPKITKATFEPVYRAAKTVQGATRSGVTYVRFGELMQAFSTELGIAKDHKLNATDQKLLAIYQEAYDAYDFSAPLFLFQIEHPSLAAAGIPLEDADEQKVERYGLRVNTVNSTARQRVFGPDSMQRVWQKADGYLESATTVYLGKRARTP